MIMDRLSMDEEDSVALHNVESFVLDRLLTQHASASNPSISIGILTEFLDPAMSPLFDQAIEDLIAQSLIHSDDGENYQITPDGVKEVKSRKREAIPL